MHAFNTISIYPVDHGSGLFYRLGTKHALYPSG